MPLLPRRPAHPSEIEVQPLHRLARVPVHLTRRAARLALLALVAADLALVGAFLSTGLPECPRPASLELGGPATIPWSFDVLKLWAAAALAALMALSYPYDRRADPFWWLAAAVAALLGLADMAGLHRVWVAAVAPAVLGGPVDARLELVSQGAPLAVLYLAAAARLPAWSRAGTGAVAASAAAFVAAWLGTPEVLAAPWTAAVGADAVAAAWHHGLIGLSRSLLLGGLMMTVAEVQARAVRYVYSGDAP